MTSERFKEIYERSGHTPIVLLYEIFREEKPKTEIDLHNFQNMFRMWLMMVQPFSHQNESISKLVEHFKDKYK